MPEPQGARIPAPRVHPPHAAKAMSNQQMIPDGLLGSDRVGDTLFGEARLGGTRELLLRRRTPTGLRGVALALLHEARQGRPGEFLVRRLSLAGCLRRKRAGGR